MTTSGNSLAAASSSYLRSASHQPIQWREWGPEAVAAAQREDKPILLDIGAVWCHWCHVMDRESYDDPEVAAIVNEHFVAVKVDRDERPDVDSRYQAAISAISGQGGWPLTGFLTPDGKPFYGGTYFPPQDGYGRPSFKRVLTAIAQAYREKHSEVLEQAGMVLEAVSRAETFAGGAAPVPPDVVERIVDTGRQLFDPRNGGFGSSPKFPHPAAVDLVLHSYARSGDPQLQEMAVATLEHMARGGVYDQLAGGFHRYSVDERWVVPHFEKMSYDNSELLKNYVHGYQATGRPFFAAVARDIIRWMDACLSDRGQGGFYASQDADYSLDDDGDYFTWTMEEAKAALGEDEFRAAQLYYDIGEIGEMHHNPAKNVLYVRASVEEIAVRLGTQQDRVGVLLEAAKTKLYEARLQRPTPYIDKTVYVSWNALCVPAYLEAAGVLYPQPLGARQASGGGSNPRQFALRSLDRILSQGWNQQSGLKHLLAYSDPQAGFREVRGLLDDYAFTVLACVDAYHATADLSYFRFARSIADRMIADFYDSGAGGFFDMAGQPGQEALGALVARRKPFQDSPTPAGNSAAALALLRLHTLAGEAGYREKAEQTLRVFAGVAGQVGIFAGTYGIAACLLGPHTQVVVLGNDALAQQLYAAAIAPFALSKTVLRLAHNEAAPQNLPPALAETIPALPAVKEGKSCAVICANFACRPPISDPDELAKALRESLAGR